jgi:aminopeptidase N
MINTGNLPFFKFSLSKACILLLIIAYGLPDAVSQVSPSFYNGHHCTHLCAHTKQQSPNNGIYQQDPRVHNYDVKFYGLDLTVNPSNAFLDGSVRVVAEIVKDNTQNIILELTNNYEVSEVIYQGNPVQFSIGLNIIIITIDDELPKGTIIDLEIFYSGQPLQQGFFSGIQRSTNSLVGNVVWTLSEPHNARQWFPCKQVLEDKADSVWIFITVPEGYTGASNGLLTGITELPGELKRFEWKTYYPIAYYLISMAVANYQEYNFYAPLSTDKDSVFVQNFIYNHPQVLLNERENLERTRDFMILFSQIWGDYPFADEKYGHAQAPMGGAMEHQTLSTMGYFGFDITAHELAHHWFGNYVTCATWSDIWINEGFASYGEFLAREFILNRQTADDWMRSAHELVKAAPDGSVYIPPFQLNDVWRIFNGRLSYKKGAAIIHQIRFELNDDDLFFKVLEDFRNNFSNNVATGDDFRKSMEESTGRDWDWFFDQWYYGEGYPIYQIKWKQEGSQLTIQSSQSTSAGIPSFFKGTLDFLVETDLQNYRFRFFQDQPLQTFNSTIEGITQKVIFDPDKYMLKSYILVDTGFIDLPVSETIYVSPNPFHEKINLTYTSLWHRAPYIVSDISGRIVARGEILPGNFQIDLSGAETGLYLLKVYTTSGDHRTFKLIKE